MSVKRLLASRSPIDTSRREPDQIRFRRPPARAMDVGCTDGRRKITGLLGIQFDRQPGTMVLGMTGQPGLPVTDALLDCDPTPCAAV